MKYLDDIKVERFEDKNEGYGFKVTFIFKDGSSGSEYFYNEDTSESIIDKFRDFKRFL